MNLARRIWVTIGYLALFGGVVVMASVVSVLFTLYYMNER